MMNQYVLFEHIPHPRPRRANDAQVRKANGQFLAARRAVKLWQENAMVALRRFLDHHVRPDPIGEFTFEEFRLYCAMRDMEEPKSLNAWGSLPAAARRAGLCAWTGRVKPAIRPASHGRLIKIWRLI